MTGRKSKHAKLPQLFTKDKPLCHGQLKFFVGAKIEALDSKKWYQARVVNINTLSLKVLVHFEGWNSRHDKWFEHTSESLRPILSGDQKQQEGFKRKELQPGDRVLARWSDSKYYPAKINAPVNEKIYEVTFYDGFKKRLNKNCIRPDPKRTFEAFEARFKEDPGSGMPRDVSVPGTSSAIPSLPAKINRTKRRHAEPSTMADFVTIIPKKRFKHRFSGTPSDSDEFSGYIDHWEGKNKEGHTESQEAKTSSKLTMYKKKRLKGRSLELPTHSHAAEASTDESSYQDTSFGDFNSEACSSPPSETSLSPTRKISTSPTDHKAKPLKKKKKLGGNFLKIKLPLGVAGKKKRGRKPKVFGPLGRGKTGDDNRHKSVGFSANSDLGFADEKDGTTKEKFENQERNEGFVVGVNAEKSQEKVSFEEQKASSVKGSIATETGVSAPDGVVVKQKRPRGRPRLSKNRRKSEPPITTDSQTRLPRRERKLTEKGLELLQSIGSKRGVEGLLKDSYIHTEAEHHSVGASNQGDDHSQSHAISKMVVEEPNLNEATSLMVRISPYKLNRVPSEADKGIRNAKRKLMASSTATKTFDSADALAAESTEDQRGHFKDRWGTSGLQSCSEGNVEEKSSLRKESSETRKQYGDGERAEGSKTDDIEEQYSDTYSEGSGNLVIDADDDLVPKTSAYRDEGFTASGKQLENRTASPKDAGAKPRSFPRLKYTLSHEERRGNKMAKRKKVRSRLKSKLEKRQELGRSVAVMEQAATASPLESLTKMVSEKAESIGFLSKLDETAAEEAKGSSNQSEEGKLEGKPTKAFKQHRGPYKSRLKMEGSFLSMVQQDRPSQVERPACNVPAKEGGRPRGRPRIRNINRPETGRAEAAIAKEDSRKKAGEATDLPKEPLDFSTSAPERQDPKVSSKVQADLSGQGLGAVQQEVYQVPGYGPQNFLPFRGPPGSFLPPGQVLPFPGPGPHMQPPCGMPVIKSEPHGLDMMRGAQGMVPYRGMIGLAEMRAPPPEYGVLNPLPPGMAPHFPPGSVPIAYSTACMRLKEPGVPNSGVYKGQVGECPCQECYSLTSRPMDVRIGKTGATPSPGPPMQSPAMDGIENVSKESARNKDGPQDKELLITGVYSLRDSDGISTMQSKASDNEAAMDDKVVPAEENDQGTNAESTQYMVDLSKTVARKENFMDADSKDDVKTSEGCLVPSKPREFESKKKRLDLITGKLSAQKSKTETAEPSESKSGELEGPGSSKNQANDDVAISADFKQSADHAPPGRQTHSVYGAPPERYCSPTNTVASSMPQDGSMMPGFPYQVIGMDPRVNFSNHEFAPNMQPIYNQPGLPHSGYQPHIRSMPYVNYSRFPNAPPFPYGPPRYIAAPGYYVPRETLQGVTSHFQPPYGSFPVSSASQRFPAMGPGERLPAVVCKTPNCSCQLPHVAPPIQMPQKQARISPSRGTSPDQGTDLPRQNAGQTSSSNRAASTSPHKGPRKKDTMIMGDPRRLTLPLQRTKKFKTKHDRERESAARGKLGGDRAGEGKDQELQGREGASGSAEKYEDREANDFEDAGEESKENSPLESQADVDSAKYRNSSEGLKTYSKKSEKSLSKEKVLAPKEFTVKLDLSEFQCQHKGCNKSFRKASSRDYHQRYFHTPRVPQKKRKLSSCLPSPGSSDALLSPGSLFSQSKQHRNLSSNDGDAKTPEDMVSVRSGYASSVMTDENLSDREKHEDMSDEDSDESDSESEGSACVDDIIKCRCEDLEEQGFMIQCEQCFTWQHGDCVNLSIQTVPKKYLCYVCTNPEGLRSCFKYKNNFDWFKKGMLPSLVEIEGENQERIANIMQASHALMEDVANIFDVINGIKRKLTILNKPLHPCLRFWEKCEEKSKENEETKAQSLGESQIEPKDSVECDKSVENRTVDSGKNENNVLGGKPLTTGNGQSDEGNAESEATKEKTEPEERLKEPQQETNTTSADNTDSDKEPAQESKETGGDLNETDSVIKTDSQCPPSTDQDDQFITENPKDENCELEIVYAKLNLLDHLDNIEVELNKRMDEIESNLDVLEQKYSEAEAEKEAGQAKSSFKIALPDMAPIARHLNMINKQLIDAK